MFSPIDEYYTTREIWESVSHFIPKDKIIWECFHAHNSFSAKHLRDLGFEVIYEDVDFFTHDYGDILVSNIPGTQKKEVLPRLKQLDKPFIMIFPTQSLQTRFLRDLFKDEKLQIIFPSAKLRYHGGAHPRGASFYTCFICYKMNFDKDVYFI